MVEQVVLWILAVTEKPSIELPAVLVQIELQKPLIALFVYCFNSTPTFTSHYMYLGEDIDDNFMRPSVGLLMCLMRFEKFLQPEKTFTTIRYRFRVLGDTCCNK